MNKDINLAAGKAIAKARNKIGLSQSGLAQTLGKTRASVSNIERGKQAMSLALFCQIAHILHASPVDLLEGVMHSRATLSKKTIPKSIEEMFVGAQDE